MKTLEIIQGARTVWVDPKPFDVPGTDLTIWKVKLQTDDGTRELFSTMSKQIANEEFKGDVEIYENDKGKVYARKAPTEQPVPHSPQSNPSPTAAKWQPRDDAAIQAQFAIKGAIELHNATQTGSKTEFHYIENTAKTLFDMIGRVKGGSESPDPKAMRNSTESSTVDSTGISGYDKFKASKPQSREPSDAEAASLYASIASSEIPAEFN